MQRKARPYLRDDRGFALAMAIFALVILAVVVAGGYFSAAQEFQIGRGMKAVTVSFYSGESGINEILETWDGITYNNLAAGDSMIIGPVSLEGGGRYSAIVKRVGSAADDVKRYFYIEVSGRPPVPFQGERRQAVIVRARFPDLCCLAAVTAVDSVDLSGGGNNTDKIIGNDAGPPLPVWTAACASIAPADRPGVIVPNAGLVIDSGKVDGSPIPIQVNAGLNRASVLNLGDMSYAELVTYADIVIDGPYNFTGTQPTVVNGRCDRSNPNNWGEPRDPNHPCFNYFPIIHVRGGDLTLTGPGVGQGILLVGSPGATQPDLRFSGQFEFYGLVYTVDALEMGGSSSLDGGAYVAENVEISGMQPRIRHSRCAVERAVRLSSLSRPRLVPGRAWVQLF